MKKSILLICTLFLCSSLFAEFKQFGVSIEPVFGVMNGEINEYVTYFNDDNVRTKESELDWDVKNIKLYGAEVSFDLFKYINLNITAVKGIAGSSGYMQDYDWLNPFGGDPGIPIAWLNDDPEELTNYSKHNNTFNNYSKLTFGLGANIRLPAKITIVPGVNITEEYFKMTGSGGYTYYKSNNWQYYYFDKDEEVITYEQSLESWLFGVKLNIETIPHTFIQLNFAASPLSANIEDMDTHLETKYRYNDKIYNCLDLEGNAKIFLMINKNAGIGIKGSIQYIPAAYGADWCSNGSYWYIASEEGGTQRLLWSVQAIGIIRF